MADPPQTPFSFHSNKSLRDPKTIGLWTIGRTIGKGASGRVRIARHSKSGQYAAIKIISKSSLPPMLSQVSLNRLADVTEHVQLSVEREIVVMKLINHPNIMKLYDVWETSSDLYLVLEYVQGGELFDYLCNKGRLPSEEALIYFQQIISAVDYCHRFSIAHRDLKPENILLDEQSNIKIADFGMAAWQSNPQEAILRTSCGSPHYAAPEIINGEPYNGAAADIWSCGVILHALLVGKLPFDDDDCPALLEKISRGKFIMPTDISPQAQDLLRCMLEKDVKRRITMSGIMKHPFFLSQAPPQTDYVLPDLENIAQPISSVSALDPDIFSNLRTLWHGTSDAALIDSLINEERNWQKGIYHMLVDYRSRNPQIYDDEEREVARLHKERKHRRQQRRRADASPSNYPPRAAAPTPRSASRRDRFDVQLDETGAVKAHEPMMLKPPPAAHAESPSTASEAATTSSLLAPFSPLWETLDLPPLTVPEVQNPEMQTFLQQIVTHLNVLQAKAASSDVSAWTTGSSSNVRSERVGLFQTFQPSAQVDTPPAAEQLRPSRILDFHPRVPSTIEELRFAEIQPLSFGSKTRANRPTLTSVDKENQFVDENAASRRPGSGVIAKLTSGSSSKRKETISKSIKIVEPVQVLQRRTSKHNRLPQTPVSILSTQANTISNRPAASLDTPVSPSPSPLPSSTAKRTWLDSVFKLKAPNYTLHSRYSANETRSECRRLLMELDLLVAIEDNERMGVLKCRSMDIPDPFRVQNMPKTVKFRVEGERAPFQLSQDGFTMALMFFHEKGSFDAFQEIYHSVRTQWTLDRPDTLSNAGSGKPHVASNRRAMF
ncbi:Pkinase-domain-containing protein [Coprinopsis marcescibilis]|uniref:non-specific serine/threonine protein kinase n=1 Tax=Coprinopsis marcescibilis TaxID=230819 RepID=A0A5C3L9M5_COPMA|nr:Pkinase-domain-containing protein [Coprinopsis marcescibilis]